MIIINIIVNNNNARAKLICALIIINKDKNPGKVLVQSIQSTNPDFLPLIINIITVPVVHTMADIPDTPVLEIPTGFLSHVWGTGY